MIRLESVTKTYSGGTTAVKNLSLEVGQGEFCIFLGPSGCGKTTSLKMINRLIPLSSGRILIDGVDTMQQDPNELRRNIGYAIQGIGLFPHLTVAENIATVPKLKKWPKAKQRSVSEELLELVGLDPGTFIDRYPSELSGGQQQRVGVARCLGGNPPILLMDEPFGAIDPITRNRLQDEFLKIQDQLKKTIVFVTHDLNEAIKMGDKIALMRNGELMQYADPTTLLNAPKDQFVRDFIGADRVLKGLRLLRARDVMQDPPVTILDEDDPAEVRARLDRAGMPWAMVTDSSRRFLGWVTADELEPGKSVRDTLIPPEVTAMPGTPLNEALSLMFNSAIGTLAVINGEDRMIGVLSFDILREVLGQQAADLKADLRAELETQDDGGDT
jgi:osmoprotectant transport system ATP-binding protein